VGKGEGIDMKPANGGMSNNLWECKKATAKFLQRSR